MKEACNELSKEVQARSLQSPLLTLAPPALALAPLALFLILSLPGRPPRLTVPTPARLAPLEPHSDRLHRSLRLITAGGTQAVHRAH